MTLSWGRKGSANARRCDFLADDDTVGADSRAKMWATIDPFPKVDRSLLSSVAIRNYARVTGMVHPFADERIKAASYEVGMGGSFIYWKDGIRIDEPIDRRESITLPANSISFVQTNVKFRLPHYIGMRFNLQIAHVHRGLLLGTGPLVDPGFEGILLIPLHNLTNSPYTMLTIEPLIWVEFTKTTFGQDKISAEYDEKCLPNFLFPERKKNRDADYYLARANKGNPIASSIPDVIAKSAEDARKSAEQAAAASTISADAKRLADRADKRIFYIGLGTGVAAIIAVIAIYVTALSAIQDASSAVHGSADIVEQARRTEKERSAETVTIRQLSARMNALEERERRKAQESLNTTGSVEKSGQ
jgi:deoxycytidine triphosphate deaminase